MKLIHGDCLEMMKDIPDNSVDLLLTSPPYSVGKEYDETVDIPTFLTAIFSKIETNGIFAWQTGNRIKDGFVYPMDLEYHHIFKANGFNLINRVVWTFGHGLHCTKRLSGRYETICFYSRSKIHTFNLDPIRVPQKYPNKKYYKGPKKGQLSGNPLGKNPTDVWNITNVKNNHPEKTEHPCQFPEELCERAISAFSNVKDTVSDPFMGSGTTGVICKNLNRNFIGIEKDETYFNIAKERINQPITGELK